jgi:hypothetical protein
MVTAWRWRRDTRIEALGDSVLDAPVSNVPLGVLQERVVVGAGLSIRDTGDPGSIDDEEYLLFYDNVFVSPALLGRFLKAARLRAAGAPGCYQLALEVSPFTRLACFTGEQREHALENGRRCMGFGIFWVAGKEKRRLENAVPLVVDQRRKDFPIPFSSRIPTMSDVVVPVTDLVVVELTSWVHLWLANMYSIAIELFARVRSPRRWPWLARKSLWGAITAGSLAPYRVATSIAGKLVVQGRGCRIHPSAVVEASVLGRNVEIGPGSVVRGSILGDGVRVFEQSNVDLSVLGDGVLIHSQGMVKLTLAYPEAAFNWCQTGVVGERAYLSGLFRPLDVKFRGEVKVLHQGRLCATVLPFLGCCIGHRALVSGDSRLAPGRVIPNDCRILTDMGAITGVPPLPTDEFLVDRGGVIEPWKK